MINRYICLIPALILTKFVSTCKKLIDCTAFQIKIRYVRLVYIIYLANIILFIIRKHGYKLLGY